mmetsp:Transcript_26206/g.39615  ORF Transcript_26206/g.39615 Transcript_26206/m.39615 type:complete len:116 (-) Transcript_26206:27-374(-)
MGVVVSIIRDVPNMLGLALTSVLLMEVESVVSIIRDVRKVLRVASAATSVKLMEVRSSAAALTVEKSPFLEESAKGIKTNVLLQDAQTKGSQSTVSVGNTSHRNTSYREHQSPLL